MFNLLNDSVFLSLKTMEGVWGANCFASIGMGSGCAFLVFTLLILFATFRHKGPSKRYNTAKKDLKCLPGPRPWPLLGSLHHLGQHDIPFEGFTKLKKVYGDVFKIRLGGSDCVVVNNIDLRDEVLIQKANDFDARPDFERFRMLFGGKKQNALAFCDYDPLQALRRDILATFTFPYSHSSLWDKLDTVCQSECQSLLDYLSINVSRGMNVMDIKEIVLKASANIFNSYFCGVPRLSYDNPLFKDYVSNFDQVFWEVNTGRLADFVPWTILFALFPIMRSIKNAKKVREFVERYLIEGRTTGRGRGNDTEVFLDELMPYIEGEKAEMDKNTAMYALEDILGGHCAVGCITIRALYDLAGDSGVQNSIRNEMTDVRVSNHVKGPVYSMRFGERLHWVRAALFETIRMLCSPIVPHKATRDTSIGGYFVEKGSLIFFNNHELSYSEELWTEGQTRSYMPNRFLKPSEEQDGKIKFMRPRHFKPFSHGKRSCMGYKLVENISVALISAIMEQFEISHPNNIGEPKTLPKGLLGLPPNQIRLQLKKL